MCDVRRVNGIIICRLGMDGDAATGIDCITIMFVFLLRMDGAGARPVRTKQSKA